MDEQVLPALIWSDKTKAFGGIEPAAVPCEPLPKLLGHTLRFRANSSAQDADAEAYGKGARPALAKATVCTRLTVMTACTMPAVRRPNNLEGKVAIGTREEERGRSAIRIRSCGPANDDAGCVHSLFCAPEHITSSATRKRRCMQLRAAEETFQP